MGSKKQKNLKTENIISTNRNSLRDIYVTGDITEGMYQDFVASLRELDQTPGKITIILNTGGGSLTAALAMCDFIQLAKNRVECICTGTCLSAGMIVMCVCDLRYSTKNCRFMVHQAGLKETSGNVNDIKQASSEIELINNTMQEILAQNSDLLLKEVVILCKDTTYMSPEQVKGYGWIDEIL